jgi:hypothetical protein
MTAGLRPRREKKEGNRTRTAVGGTAVSKAVETPPSSYGKDSVARSHLRETGAKPGSFSCPAFARSRD